MPTNVWSGHFKRKIPLGRPRHRWEDNIKMNLREGVCEGGKLNLTDLQYGPVTGFCDCVN
jgi:hypothetical protein